MSVALVVVSDDRPDYHMQSLLSALGKLCEVRFDQIIHVDDREHELGFAGAIQHGWSQVECDFVFHLEADFTFNRPVPLVAMKNVLIDNPHLVQIALLRQPWNDQEKAAGGIVALHPEDYEPVARGAFRWIEHRRCVTTNPALWPRWVIDRGWPQIRESEGHFGIDLFASDPALRAAYWGDGSEWVTHIGEHRTGRGY